MEKGNLIILSGPSGSGKDTILTEVFKEMDDVKFSISCVTRSRRPGEENSTRYTFLTKEEFKELLDNDGFIEYNEYMGNFYGTPKKPVEDALANGTDIVLEIDVNGAKNVAKMYPDAVKLFIMPPSKEVLRKRLSGRGSETPEQVEGRLNIALKEIEQASFYDFIVVNDALEDAVDDVINIIKANRCKLCRKKYFINEVLKKC